MSTHVQEIKDRLSIVDVVGSYIKLDKAGANYKARCPFHNEKTPSFFVSPDRGSFYCFGCQAKGDIFTFVEKFEGLDFMGALKTLAERAGVKLDRVDPSKDNRKELLYRIMEDAARWFEERLSSEPAARAYILGRGLSERTLADFRVGYAPAAWRELRAYLKSRGYRDEDIMAVGLIKRSDKPATGGDPLYDVFRGRIMFPISDSSGRVVAFSGRIVEDDGKSPKYLNSPETALYSKSKTLYGIDKAKRPIRERGYAILVEGQMDLVMSHQAGFTNTVAASGTAFTEDDGADSAFGLLTRLSENIVLAFDSDAAGQKAIRRIAPALAQGMNVKVVDIRGGKDPADIIKADPKAWAKMLEAKKDFLDYLVAKIGEAKLSIGQVGKAVASEVFPIVAAVPGEVPRSQMIRKAASELGLQESALWTDFQRFMRSRAEAPRQSGASAPTARRLDRFEAIERKLGGLYHSKAYFDRNLEKRADLERVMGADAAKIVSLDDASVSELTLEAEVTYGSDIDPGKEWQALLYGLEEEIAKKSLERAMGELVKAEKAQADTRDIMREISVLSKKIQDVRTAAEKL